MRARLCNPKQQFYEGSLGTVLIARSVHEHWKEFKLLREWAF
jgi:hypothetical protein